MQTDNDEDLFVGGDAFEDDNDDGAGDRGDSVEPEVPEPDAASVTASAEEADADEDAEVEDTDEPDAEAETSDDTAEPEDDSDDAEPEEDDEPTEPAAKKGDKSDWIPPGVLATQKERARRLEAENKELEERLAAVDAAKDKGAGFDFDGKEREYMEMVADGEFEKAQTVRAEIRAAERELFKAENAQVVQQASQRTQDEMAYDAALVEINAKYPQFDPSSDSYDEALVKNTLGDLEAFVASGMRSADALQKAVSYNAHMAGLQDATAQPETQESVTKPTLVKKPNKAAKQAAAQAEPPASRGMGDAHEARIDVANMDEDEFDALPEAKLRALRGDMVG